MVQEQTMLQEEKPRYNETTPTRKLEDIVFRNGGVDSASDVYLQLKSIETEFQNIGIDGSRYNGAIGNVRKKIDEIGYKLGWINPEDRLKKIGENARKVSVSLENMVSKGTQESGKIAKQTAEIQMKQVYAFALIGRYEGMINEIEGKAEEKTREYDEVVRKSMDDPDVQGYEIIAGEINSLNADKVEIESKLYEAAQVVRQCERNLKSVQKKKGAIDFQVDTARFAKGKIQGLIEDLGIYSNNPINPQKIAELVLYEEQQSRTLHDLVGKLDGLFDKQIEAYDGLTIDNLEDPERDEKTEGLCNRVSTQRDEIIAQAKKCMEAKRAS